jgi:16S rRNA (guanine527-N7)-methyltransferase
MTMAAAAESCNVPRGTRDRLNQFAALLRAAPLNLIAASTFETIANRHFDDSLQLLPLAAPGNVWMDMGSGGGLPGIVLAIADPGGTFHLIESTGKKAAFLDEAVAKLALENVIVHNARVEQLAALHPDVITARAFAPLDRLLGWGLIHARPDTRWILPKGARFAEELAVARKAFAFDCETVQSQTHADARILVLGNVKRRNG